MNRETKQPKTVTGWHFADTTLRDGSPLPAKGVTLTHTGEVRPCESGYHASKRAIDALQYAPGCNIARVRLLGEIKAHGDPVDKYAASRRKNLTDYVDVRNVLVEWPRRVALHVIRVTAADALDAAGLKNEAEKLRALKDDCDMSAAYAAADAAARAAADAARADARAAAHAARAAARADADAARADARAAAHAARAAADAARADARAAARAAADAARAAADAARADARAAAHAAYAAADAAARAAARAAADAARADARAAAHAAYADARAAAHAAYAAAYAAARAAADAARAAYAAARKKINNLYNSWLEEMLLEMLEGVSNDAI